MNQLSTLFNTAALPAELLAKLAEVDTNDVLAGGGGSVRRISIEGGAFREIIDGKEVNVSDSRMMDVVILNASPVGRLYYNAVYTKGVKSSPVCWSVDGRVPSPDAEEPQHHQCNGCRQDIKGSGQNDTRACRFQQRLAVALPGNLDQQAVYQVTLPAKSIFGGDNNKMPLQAYGRFLKSHNTNVVSIVTEMKFDTSEASPKLIFRSVRPLTAEELNVVLDMRNSSDAEKAVKMSFKKSDGGNTQHATPPQPATPDVEEPRVVSHKPTPAPATKPLSLEEVVRASRWDD